MPMVLKLGSAVLLESGRQFSGDREAPSKKINKMALKVLIPFPTTYECESAFSALLSIKPTARNRLDAIHNVTVALSKTEPNIAELIAQKQVHPSQ